MAAIDEDDGGGDVAGGEFGDFCVGARGEGSDAAQVVVVHLEAAVADDLEPVHHTLDGGIGI